jgi:hypothetical protein
LKGALLLATRATGTLAIGATDTMSVAGSKGSLS